MPLIWILLSLAIEPPTSRVAPRAVVPGNVVGAAAPDRGEASTPPRPRRKARVAPEKRFLAEEKAPLEAAAPDTRAEPARPWDQVEQWVKEGKLKARSRFAWDYRRFDARPFRDIRDRNERDQEFRSYLEVETHGLGKENVNAYLHAEYRKDIDGTSDPSFHKSILTSHSSKELLRFHSAYLEVTDIWDRVALRLGRQQTVEVHPVTFDGARAALADFELLGMPASCRFFGGRIHSDFSNLRQDGVFGGGLTLRPDRDLAIELRDVRYVRNRLEVEGRFSPWEPLSLLGLLGLREGKPRDGRLEGRFAIEALDATLTAGLYRRYRYDFRLDFLSGQSTRRFDERRFFLPELAPYDEFYLRLSHEPCRWVALGADYLAHRLRDLDDVSAFDTDFREVGGHVDLRLGPGTLRSEVRYYHADRRLFTQVSPRFPQPALLVDARVGERDHLEYHLDSRLDLGRGWRLEAGLVWHRINYIDVKTTVDHEQSVDYLFQLRGRISPKTTFLLRYELTRDMEFFSPYFDRFHALSWIVDVSL